VCRIRRFNPAGVTKRGGGSREVFREWIRSKRAFNQPRTILENEICKVISKENLILNSARSRFHLDH